MKLYLLRHGETSWNKEDRTAYNKNLVLNDTGIKQAEDRRKFNKRTELLHFPSKSK